MSDIKTLKLAQIKKLLKFFLGGQRLPTNRLPSIFLFCLVFIARTQLTVIRVLIPIESINVKLVASIMSVLYCFCNNLDSSVLDFYQKNGTHTFYV